MGGLQESSISNRETEKQNHSDDYVLGKRFFVEIKWPVIVRPVEEHNSDVPKTISFCYL